MSFFDEVLTTVENNRFLRAVQDSNTPVNLDLKSTSDPNIQLRLLDYSHHQSYNIRNALNINLSLNWCFLKYLSSLQLHPTSSTFIPQYNNSTSTKKGKVQRYFFLPLSFIDHSGQLILRETIPQRVVDRLQLDTQSSPYISAYFHFVTSKERQKQVEQDIANYEHQVYTEGFEAVQKQEQKIIEQSRNQSPAKDRSQPVSVHNQSSPTNNNSPNFRSTTTLIDEGDLLNDESQLRISTATSHGQNIPTLSYKKIGRILLRMLQFASAPVQNRYHLAVNLWNELFVLVYAFQDQIKIIHRRIQTFREEHHTLQTQYARRLRDRLNRVYLHPDKYKRRDHETPISPSMEFAKEADPPYSDQSQPRPTSSTRSDKNSKDNKNDTKNPIVLTTTSPSPQFVTQPNKLNLHETTSSIFFGMNATNVTSSTPLESLPKTFTDVPIKSQSQIICCDPALLYISYLLADGVLHHIYQTIRHAVQSYDDADKARVHALDIQFNNFDPHSTSSQFSPGTSSSYGNTSTNPQNDDGGGSGNERPTSGNLEKRASVLPSRLGQLLGGSRADPEELKRQQQDQLWNRRKNLILRINPFDAYYSTRNQSPHLEEAAQRPLGVLQEEEDEPIHSTTKNTYKEEEQSPYVLFNGLEYIPAEGPPHEDVLNQLLSPIYFSPYLFLPLVRCPILYPLLEPLLLAAKHQPSSNPTTPTHTKHEAKNDSTQENNIESSTPSPLSETPNKPVPPSTAHSTSFVDTQYFTLWIKLQCYLEQPWSLSDDFCQFRILGRGAFGTVTGVQHSKLLSLYAVKEISKRMVKASEKGYDFMVINERRMLKAVHSPFVLHLHASLHDREKLYLFTDICLGGDLSHHLKQSTHHRFHYARARFYAAQILLGLEHMHQRSIVYRDLKPSNILLDSSGNAKISDLGLSLRLPKNGKILKHVAGTAGYWAPEIVSKRGTFTTSDYWSFGVMLYEMLTGHRPKLKTDVFCKRGKELLKDKSRRNRGAPDAGILSGLMRRNGNSNQSPQVNQINNKQDPGDDDDLRGSFSHNSQYSQNLRQSGLGDALSGNEESCHRSASDGYSDTPRGSSSTSTNSSLLIDGFAESALYSKFTQRSNKHFLEYVQTHLNSKNSNDWMQQPFFTPAGKFINPGTTSSYISQRFIILPTVIQSAKKTPSNFNIPPNLHVGNTLGVNIAQIDIDSPLPTPHSQFVASTSIGHEDSLPSSHPSPIANCTDSNSVASTTPRPHGFSPRYQGLGMDESTPLAMNSTPKQRAVTLKRQGSGHRNNNVASTIQRSNAVAGASGSNRDSARDSSHASHFSTNEADPHNKRLSVEQSKKNQPENNDHQGENHQHDDKNRNKEEMGSLQSQVLDLLKGEDYDDTDNNNDPEKDLDYDDDDLPANNTTANENINNKSDNTQQQYSYGERPTLVPNSPSSFTEDIDRLNSSNASSQSPGSTLLNSIQKEKDLINPIPPHVMEGVQVKTPLYDKTNKHQLIAPGLGHFHNVSQERYVVGTDKDGATIRDFRVISTTEDNIISGAEIERAFELHNNESRWSPFDQSQKVEQTSRQEKSILDVDVDYNIDAAYLTTFAVDLLIRLFDPDPHTRLGAKGIEEIKQHAFFTTPIDGFGAIDWDQLSQQLVVPPYTPDSNTVHAKSMDELTTSPHDQKWKHIKLSAADDTIYEKWYHIDQEHREKELVRILNNIDLDSYLWGRKSGDSSKSPNEKTGCCTIM